MPLKGSPVSTPSGMVGGFGPSYTMGASGTPSGATMTTSSMVLTAADLPGVGEGGDMETRGGKARPDHPLHTGGSLCNFKKQSVRGGNPR